MKSTYETLDNDIKDILKNQGITKLYPPQNEALPYVLDNKNVILSVPTAAGKSLVAYLAIIHRLRKESGKAMYVVPLRALAREKYDDLKQFEHLGFKVALSTGDLDESDPRLSRYDIIVCTSEKADSLLRHGISWLDQIKILVIDEIHLIHDPTRGPTLEVIIARFKSLNPQTQLIALSATIKNAVELADWLQAKLIQTSWRPVPLKEGVLYNKTIKYGDGSLETISGAAKTSLDLLVQETISHGGQALVFVNNRRSTVSLAQKLGLEINAMLTTKEKQQLQKICMKLEKSEPETTSISHNLIECIKDGVSFHNAGLSTMERHTVEQGFKDRIIKCIVATPTLAAGVNTPARRVIIRDLWRYDSNFGMTPLPILEYKQQAGRAGRPGYDVAGEAITIAKTSNQQESIFTNYVLADTEPIFSKLGSQAALRTHILASIASNFVGSRDDILGFINSTFFAYMTESYTLDQEIDTALQFLLDNQFIESDTHFFHATSFGHQTSSLYIDPLSALQLRTALEQSCHKETSPISFLHAISSTPDIRSLYLRSGDSWVEEKAEQVRASILLDIPLVGTTDYEWFLSSMKTALLLADWIEEHPYDRLVTKFNVWPGDLHNILEIAEWLLHATREFARMYNFTCVSELNDLIVRIQNGCKQELLNLVQLKGVGRVRARALFNEGFKTVHDLRGIPVERLAKIKTIGDAVAKSIKKQLGEGPHKGNTTLK